MTNMKKAAEDSALPEWKAQTGFPVFNVPQGGKPEEQALKTKEEKGGAVSPPLTACAKIMSLAPGLLLF